MWKGRTLDAVKASSAIAGNRLCCTLQAGLAPRMFRELFDEIRNLQVINSGCSTVQLPGKAMVAQLAGLRGSLNPKSLLPLGTTWAVAVLT